MHYNSLSAGTREKVSLAKCRNVDSGLTVQLKGCLKLCIAFLLTASFSGNVLYIPFQSTENFY